MLLCWCIGRAAAGVEEFYTLPVGRKFLQYDALAVNTIVKNRAGGVSSCDIRFSTDLDDFNREYLTCTARAAETCEDRDLSPECMVIGTSAIVATELDLSLIHI